MRRALAVLTALALLAVAALPALAGSRPRWDTRVFALIPKPGFPARAYVAPNRRVYEGTYDNPTGDTQRSRVFEYNRAGTLLRSWTLFGQDLSAEHGVQVATTDSRGRLLLLDRTPARALLLNTSTGRFKRYATFADLPACPGAQPAKGCSPTLSDDPPVPNYSAWGRDGSLYVTDFLQGVIWRVRPGGGKARVWLSDRLLDGTQFGTTGIVLKPNQRKLLFAQQSSGGGGDGDATTGKLYSVRIRHNGRPGAIHQLWESQPVDGPDGFAIARSGNIYVALAGSNQIVELDSSGNELERFPAVPQSGANGSAVPFDTPSSAMFLRRRLMVANQAFFSGDSTHQAILDVKVGERGRREFIPRRAGLRPRAR